VLCVLLCEGECKRERIPFWLVHMSNKLPHIPWGESTSEAMDSTARKEKKKKKEYVSVIPSTKETAALQRSKGRGTPLNATPVHSELSSQGGSGGGGGRDLEKERKKSTDLQKQISLLADVIKQQTDQIEQMTDRETELEQQLKVMSVTLQDKRALLKQELLESKKQLSQLEEEEEPLSEDEMWELDQMIELAIQAKENSYSPYSKFRVGCILKTQSGEYYKGCNVENASYGLAICAERTAIVKAVSEGHTKFSKIIINSDLQASFCTPCGACRQFMREFGEYEIILTKPDKSYKRTSVLTLLPESFGPDDLDSHAKQ